jgi:hypothetical protein
MFFELHEKDIGSFLSDQKMGIRNNQRFLLEITSSRLFPCEGGFNPEEQRQGI